MEILLTTLFIVGLVIAYNIGRIHGQREGWMDCLESQDDENLNDN